MCVYEWRSTSTSVAGVTARVSVCAVAVSGREPLVRRVFLFERVTAKMLDLVRFVLWFVPLNHILNRLCYFQTVNSPLLLPLSSRLRNLCCVEILRNLRLILCHLVRRRCRRLQTTWYRLLIVCHVCPYRLLYLRPHSFGESLIRTQPVGYTQISI